MKLLQRLILRKQNQNTNTRTKPKRNLVRLQINKAKRVQCN